MLQRFFEWYRVVSPKPDDDTVRKRRAAVTELVNRLLEEKDYDLLVATTSAAVNGLEGGFSQESPVVQATVATIRNHQPAFPEDLSENALEIRACCMITLGELLNQYPEAGTTDALLAATLLVSANAYRPPPKEKHLRQALDELGTAALEVVEQAASARRRRESDALKELGKLSPPGDVAGFWNQLLPRLKACFADLNEQAEADREELQVLWWLYRGYSETAREKLLALDPGAAALCSGGELGGLVLCPPAAGVRQIVQRAAEEGRKRADCAAKGLKQVAPRWEAELLPLLGADDANVADLVRRHPALLPLSWLCRRLRDSGMTTGWEREFESKTGFPSAHALPPGDWAVQAFNERVAQRVYQQSLGD